VVICGAGIPELATGAAALEKIRQSGRGIQVLRLPADFSVAEAGQAGMDLLDRLQALLTP
jgi:hypothetical protein